ncbi:helix-turn-helix transcriptional regulator [Capnocytophaga sp. 051621]|jgi:bacteriophage CI repressor|uniref:Helix-turn-helix transcriptional regulator n=2 Tax=Capnocytophaga TaxID=1016 RepID=A0ABS1YTC0_9FLAO|nr:MULTISPECIES: helix-turn-helix transcriptional regulator [Capnocytophaga]MBI1646026.1 helix-turn-helix transcriptional regulator [Capnocytophaga periodontitidis]MBM0649632.1 helix-turn-helix transcriptional regulator [Capnocytophaga genosp. AHN8471]MBM0663019.1 helix-turn-helix transcriptional regulator [Capnocytophaga genosp. AHN8471]
MLNTSDFSIRLQQVMDYYGLNAAAFADTLEIQRSGISHLLSERNKPSLDFILKLIEKFPEVDMYWITQGKGTFPRKEDKEVSVPKKVQQPDLFSDIPEIEMERPSPTLSSPIKEEKKVSLDKEVSLPSSIVNNTVGKKIKRIILFYEDNHFEVFDS